MDKFLLSMLINAYVCTYAPPISKGKSPAHQRQPSALPSGRLDQAFPLPTAFPAASPKPTANTPYVTDNEIRWYKSILAWQRHTTHTQRMGEGGGCTGDTCHSSLLNSRVFRTSCTSLTLPSGIFSVSFLPFTSHGLSSKSSASPCLRRPHYLPVSQKPPPTPPLRRKRTSRGLSTRWCQGGGAERHWRCQVAVTEVWNIIQPLLWSEIALPVSKYKSISLVP